MSPATETPPSTPPTDISSVMSRVKALLDGPGDGSVITDERIMEENFFRMGVIWDSFGWTELEMYHTDPSEFQKMFPGTYMYLTCTEPHTSKFKCALAEKSLHERIGKSPST